MITHATYIGPRGAWTWNPAHGDTALVRQSDKPGVVLVQFDNTKLERGGEKLGFGWHEFPAEHFKPDAVEGTKELLR